ncbi:heterokaryon incompatibility protein-domain-containing protein [Tricladium varicosporioides]|nr:heterokaryon incompatibility protein-domain-containing protein [Hymenoscyphus varicosporioides]
MAHTQENIIPVSDDIEFTIIYEVSDNICDECQKLVGSLISGNEEIFEARWRYLKMCTGLRYRPSRLWAYTTHHSNQYDALYASYTSGCSLCTLLFVTCRNVYGVTPTPQQYSIVGLDNPDHDLTFYLCFCEISVLEKENEEFTFQSLNACPFRFFLRNGDESDFRFFRRLKELRRPLHLPGLNAMVLAANILPDSEEAIDRARKWYKDCKETHSRCRRIASPLPKRVLDLALKASTGAVTLYESKNEVVEYATLSYSWGTSLPLTTTSSNIKQYRKGLSIELLPQTLRDAVRIAQLLGFRYLWVDALCIIQDDAADWAVQAALMTDIYEGSALCISALSAKDCNSGFLKLPNILSKVGICRYPPESSESRDIFVGWKPRGYGNVVEKSHLCTRGWTFQERLVSPASLHYTNEGIFWECAEKFLSETGSGTTPYSPAGWKKAWLVARRGEVTVLPEHLGAGNQHSLERATLLQNWRGFVEDYSARKLTKSTDKLPAVAGIARAFGKQASMTYMAGLWKEDFLSDLFWSRKRDTDTLTSPQQYRAPSWSWASVDGRVGYFGYFVRFMNPSLDLQLLSYDVKEAQEGTFGQVLASSFKAMGLLQAVVIDRSKPAREDDPHTATVIEGILHGVPVSFILDQPSEWPETIISCYCLRLGIFNNDRRDSVALLLVVPTGGHQNNFRRIGVGETVVWGAEEDKGPIDYDIFIAGKRIELKML